jgi:DNA-binding transcriptional LysR family regulator
MFNWNDLRHFLAVARSGSTLGGSKMLGVDQTTVARRIEALEAALSLKLFERGQSGSRLTEAGSALLPKAEAAERAMEAVDSQAAASARGMTGIVRVTANEITANLVVTPALVEFRRLYPDIRVDLITTDRFLDLDAGDADVAIRGSAALAESSLVGRKVANVPWVLYCSTGYIERHGRPSSVEDLAHHALIGADGELTRIPTMGWMLDLAPSATIATRSTSLMNLLHAMKAGLGIAPLPLPLAGLEPDLVPCCPAAGVFNTGIWVLTTGALKTVPRVRAFIDFIAPHISATMRRLEASAPR